MTFEEALYQITNYALDDEDNPKELAEAVELFRIALKSKSRKSRRRKSTELGE